MNKHKFVFSRMETSSIKWINIDLTYYSWDSCIGTQTRKKRNKQKDRIGKQEMKTKCEKCKKTKSVFFCKTKTRVVVVMWYPHQNEKLFSLQKKKFFSVGESGGTACTA